MSSHQQYRGVDAYTRNGHGNRLNCYCVLHASSCPIGLARHGTKKWNCGVRDEHHNGHVWCPSRIPQNKTWHICKDPKGIWRVWWRRERSQNLFKAQRPGPSPAPGLALEIKDGRKKLNFSSFCKAEKLNSSFCKDFPYVRENKFFDVNLST